MKKYNVYIEDRFGSDALLRSEVSEEMLEQIRVAFEFSEETIRIEQV